MTQYIKTIDDRSPASNTYIYRPGGNVHLSQQMADLHNATTSDDKDERREARRKLEALRYIAELNNGAE